MPNPMEQYYDTIGNYEMGVPTPDPEPRERLLDKLAERRVRGRMEDIPIDGEVVEEFKQCLNQESKSPIYYTHRGFTCSCGNLMAEENFPKVSQKEIEYKVFCTNLNCSQNLLTKVVKFLPVEVEYAVDPSSP